MIKKELTQEENIRISQDNDKVVFGFWVYILTDCVLFASLFATYAVLRNNTFGGPSGHQIFNLPFVLVETLILLTSSFTSGIARIANQKKSTSQVVTWLVITFILGLSFLVMELNEFSSLINRGDSFQRSGFLSSYFTLVGTHGLHITIGLIWILVLIVQILRQGVSNITTRRLMSFNLFWHFLDIVWIFIFSIVYLMS